MSFKYLDELKMLMVAQFPWHPNHSPVPLLASKIWVDCMSVKTDRRNCKGCSGSRVETEVLS